MILYIQIIFVLALLKYCLKAALSSRFITQLCYALFAAVVAFSIYPIVINQPTNSVELLLKNRGLINNGAVLTTLEAIAGIFISITLLDNYFKPKKERKRKFFFLKIAPGILWVLAIGYFELKFIQLCIGMDFYVIALLYASLLFVILFTTTLWIKTQLKRESLKLEMKIIVNLFILIIGLLINSTIADYNLSAAQTKIEWGSLICMTSIALLFFIGGYYLPSIKQHIKTKLKWK